MTPQKIAELETAATAAASAATAAGGTDEALNKAAEDAKNALEKAKAELPPSGDPVKEELDRVKNRPKTEREKAEYALASNANRLKDLGGDPAKVLGITPPTQQDEDDEVPEWYKREQSRTATKSAVELAQDIQDEYERDLTIHHLENTVRPSGNAQQDLKTAKDLVLAAKARHFMDEKARKLPPKEHGSGGGAPPPRQDPVGELTPEEIPYTRPPWNLSKETIISKRAKS